MPVKVTLGKCIPVYNMVVSIDDFKVDTSECTTLELLQMGIIKVSPNGEVSILGQEYPKATADFQAAAAFSRQLGQETDNLDE